MRCLFAILHKMKFTKNAQGKRGLCLLSANNEKKF